MPGLIHRVRIPLSKIISINIINIPIAVIINAGCAVLFSRINPQVRNQIFMGIINTCINNPHKNLLAAGSQVPRLGRINIRIELAAGLACIVHSPKPVEISIIRNGGRPSDKVRRSILNPRRRLKSNTGLLHIHPRRQFHQGQTRHNIIHLDNTAPARLLNHTRTNRRPRRTGSRFIKANQQITVPIQRHSLAVRRILKKPRRIRRKKDETNNSCGKFACHGTLR